MLQDTVVTHAHGYYPYTVAIAMYKPYAAHIPVLFIDMIITPLCQVPNDDDDDDNDVTIHIIIAVCLSVVVILAVMALVITLIICHWRRWNRDQFRWRNIIN